MQFGNMIKGGIWQRREKRKERKVMEEETEKDEKEEGGRIQSLVASTLYPFLF